MKELAMRACLRGSLAIAISSGWNVERLEQGGGIVISSTHITTEPLPQEVRVW